MTATSTPWVLLGWVLLGLVVIWTICMLFTALWALRARRRAWREFESRSTQHEAPDQRSRRRFRL